MKYIFVVLLAPLPFVNEEIEIKDVQYQGKQLIFKAKDGRVFTVDKIPIYYENEPVKMFSDVRSSYTKQWNKIIVCRRRYTDEVVSIVLKRQDFLEGIMSRIKEFGRDISPSW